MNNFYDLEAELPSGKIVNMWDFKWKVIIVVNTASKCWLTWQYVWLEALYKKYKDQGLVILWFPCNQFANQEPGDSTSIKQQCLLNYWVTFPIFKKSDVNWKQTSEVFKYLKDNTLNIFWSRIKWNFTKFIISKDGKKIKRFAPITKPQKMEKLIIQLLK